MKNILNVSFLIQVDYKKTLAEYWIYHKNIGTG